MNNMLEKIVAQKKLELNTIPDVNYLESKPENTRRDFYCSITQAENSFSIIAEIKPQSPSEGIIAANYNAGLIAQEYEYAGANAISVLTDNKFFGGSFENLKQARSVIDAPILCKEFIISEKQIAYARYCGADACLLIASILSQKELVYLKQVIESYDMTALIEIFELSELDGVLKTNPRVIGINNRNLNNFSMNTSNSNELSKNIPDDVCVISASGIKQPSDVDSLDKNINGVLLGTALMRSQNKTQFIHEIRKQREIGS